MLKMCEKVTKIFRRTGKSVSEGFCKCRGRQDAVNDRNRSTATVRTDFVTFSHRFSVTPFAVGSNRRF